MTKTLSPAAQAVHDAFWTDKGYINGDEMYVSMANILRSAADQAAPEPIEGSKDTLLSFFTIRHRLFAIADEIEALQT